MSNSKQQQQQQFYEETGEPMSAQQIEVQGRRRLRAKIRNVTDLVKGGENEDDGGMVQVYLKQANEIIDEVQQPKEMAKESFLFQQIGHIGVQQARRKLDGKKHSLPAFSELLMQDYYQDNRGFNFKKLGKLKAGKLFRNAPVCQTMLGPMQQQPKARNSQRGRKKTQQEAQVARPRTTLDDNTEEENKQETDKIMEEMHKQLRKRPDAPLQLLILNKNSFAQTVENLFTLAFLVRDSKVEIRQDGKGGGCLVNLAHKSKGGGGSMQQSHLLQCLMKLDSDSWQRMKQIVGEEEVIMPHRTYTHHHHQ